VDALKWAEGGRPLQERVIRTIGSSAAEKSRTISSCPVLGSPNHGFWTEPARCTVDQPPPGEQSKTYAAHSCVGRLREGHLSEERVERRLAAILAADVVGYSRLMGADEEGTLAALKAVLRELVDPRIVEHRGRIVKTTGDGLLVEFASVVDAVRCAVDVQRELAERNAEVPAATRIEFRVGINLGDIIIDGGDIFGDGVNVAARLETLAEPGGICVSRVVRDQVRDKLAFAFEDMGEQQVKNIARPVHAHRIRIDAAAAAPPAASAEPAPLPLPDKPSIAILPFQKHVG